MELLAINHSSSEMSDIFVPRLLKLFCFCFFYLGFLSRLFTNHRTAGEAGGHFFLKVVSATFLLV